MLRWKTKSKGVKLARHEYGEDVLQAGWVRIPDQENLGVAQRPTRQAGTLPVDPDGFLTTVYHCQE